MGCNCPPPNCKPRERSSTGGAGKSILQPGSTSRLCPLGCDASLSQCNLQELYVVETVGGLPKMLTLWHDYHVGWQMQYRFAVRRDSMARACAACCTFSAYCGVCVTGKCPETGKSVGHSPSFLVLRYVLLNFHFVYKLGAACAALLCVLRCKAMCAVLQSLQARQV